MFKFNSDGSLELPDNIREQKEDEVKKMEGRALLITKEFVNFTPKKCILHLETGKTFNGDEFIRKIHHYWNESAEVPSKITKKDDKNFEIEIGTCLRRCADCNNLVGRYREFMEGHTIIKKGNCYFKEREASDVDLYDIR
jgi:hypothetical protein